MNFEVHTLPRAELDAAEIFSYISGRSADGALRWLNALEQAIELLAQGNPEACSLVAEDDLSERTIRQFFFKTRRGRTYRGVFTVVGNEIRILRFRGPGQADSDVGDSVP